MPTWLHSTWAPSTPCYIAYIVGCHFANEFAFAYYYSAVWICHLNQQCHQHYNYQITTEFVRKYRLYFRLRQLQFIIMRIWELVALRSILCMDVVTAFATGRAGMQFLFLFFVAAVVVGGTLNEETIRRLSVTTVSQLLPPATHREDDMCALRRCHPCFVLWCPSGMKTTTHQIDWQNKSAL